MALVEQDKLNKLLSLGIPHGVYFSEWLTANGWSNQLVKSYCDNMWLERLCRGIVYRKGDTPSAYATVASYFKQIGEGLHIAAHSALELHGFMHFVPMGKPQTIVALNGSYKPQWMSIDVYDRQFIPVTIGDFSNRCQTLTVSEMDLPVSSPEQAFAECLLLCPKHYTYMDLYLLMEQLTTLRPDIVYQVLEQAENHRVRRMYLYMAEKAGHIWMDGFDSSGLELGNAPLSVAVGGTFISKYKMTIPTELAKYK